MSDVDHRAPVERRLADRYGTHRPVHKRLFVAGTVLLAVAGIGWLAWVILFHGRPLVESDLVSFRVTGPHSAEATVSVVRRDADVEAACLLRAQAADHSVVGELNFLVGPARPATATLTQEIRTERSATTVLLVGCNGPGQSRLR